MDGQTADGAGDTDPRADAARRELLRAVMAERYDGPAWRPVVDDSIAARRRVLLGKDWRRHG